MPILYRRQRPRTILLLISLFTAACISRPVAPCVYRLSGSGASQVLVPPGIRDAAVLTGRLDFALRKPAPSTCRQANDALRVVPHAKFLRITVQRDALSGHAPAWLSGWTATLEQQGCLSPGEAAALAEQIVESVPMNPAAAWRLLHADSRVTGYVDLLPGHRLKLVSPILRDGAPANASAIATDRVSGTDSKLSLTIRTSSDFLGYEIAWYAIEPNPHGPGARLAFATSESHLGDQTTTSQQPRKDYLPFPETANYYRLFYLTRVSQADHNVAILSARTHAELERMTPDFSTDADACSKVPSCVALPKEVALTAFIRVTGNGVPVDVEVGASIADALRIAGIARPQNVMATLAVRRIYRNALVPVEFDREKSDILVLPLKGQEELRW